MAPAATRTPPGQKSCGECGRTPIGGAAHRSTPAGSSAPSVPLYLAATLLDYGAWLIGEGRKRDAEPLLDEARGIFERLEARPWLERLERLEQARVSIG